MYIPVSILAPIPVAQDYLSGRTLDPAQYMSVFLEVVRKEHVRVQSGIKIIMF